MWRINHNAWEEGRNINPMASYHAVTQEIHVLLVDHVPESLIITAKLLEMCQYRVTLVELASAAISMLASGKVKFDIVMTDINSPDLHGYKLMQQAVSMDLPIILMSVDDNKFMATRALEDGAFLYIKKPVTIEMVRYLWQHVLREKTRMLRERDKSIATSYSIARGVEFREPIQQGKENAINVGGDYMYMVMNKGKSKNKFSQRNEEYEVENKFKRKVCTEWTQELHAKFMDAIEQLGEGRCFPKEILGLMNVPGLTRMQVASHLQKCRNDNWRSPEERKSQQASVTSSDTDGSQSKPRKFGSMPRVNKDPSYDIVQVHENSEDGQSSQTRSNTEIANNGIGPVFNNITTQYQPFQSMLPGSSNVTHARNSSLSDFFDFPEMNSLTQYFLGLPQGSGANNQNSHPGPYHFGPVYPEQNSAGPSVDTRSQWNSERSNFESTDESETKGRK